MSATPVARYFPVRPEPLRMRAGLVPLGTDFGNGPVDRLHFQIDEQRAQYRTAKREVPDSRSFRSPEPAEQPALDAIRDWMVDTLTVEHPGLL